MDFDHLKVSSLSLVDEKKLKVSNVQVLCMKKKDQKGKSHYKGLARFSSRHQLLTKLIDSSLYLAINVDSVFQFIILKH